MGGYTLKVGRFIIRFKGAGEMPEADKQAIGSIKGLRVLDQSLRMLLVEASRDCVNKLKEKLPDWSILPETQISIPSPRQKLSRKK